MKTMMLLAECMAVFALSACTPTKDATAEQPEVAAPAPESAAPATPAPPGVVSMNYINAAAALAADDLAKAKASLAALAKESTGELQTLAHAAAGAADMAEMRDRFKALSALATTMELPEDYAVAFCPMFKGGAKWVQKKDKIANPYFGSAMMDCGSFLN
jgi:hypothetical protein